MNEIALAQRAIDLERDGLIAQVLESMRADCVRQWLEAKSVDDREDARRLHHLVDEFDRQLRVIVDAGNFAARKIKE